MLQIQRKKPKKANKGKKLWIKSVEVRTYIFKVLGIRIRNRIRMFLGLPDPEPLVRGTDPDPDLAPDPSLFSKIC
jgi:hypothetical protein